MPITRTPIVDDDGTGTTGTVINNAWKQEFYDQIDALAVSVGDSAFVNLTPTWLTHAGAAVTVTNSLNRYKRLSGSSTPSLLYWEGMVQSLNLPTAATYLQMTGLPFTFQNANTRLITFSGSTMAATLFGGAGIAHIYRNDGQQWASGTLVYLSWNGLLYTTVP